MSRIWVYILTKERHNSLWHVFHKVSFGKQIGDLQGVKILQAISYGCHCPHVSLSHPCSMTSLPVNSDEMCSLFKLKVLCLKKLIGNMDTTSTIHLSRGMNDLFIFPPLRMCTVKSIKYRIELLKKIRFHLTSFLFSFLDANSSLIHKWRF